MKKVLVLIANGFEDIEMVAPVDILRRCGAEVIICSITGSKDVKGSKYINYTTDNIIEKIQSYDNYDALVLPGGQLNADKLRDDKRVIEAVKTFYNDGKIVAAICAGPTVLERAGILTGKKATSYPGSLKGSSCIYEDDDVVIDGNIITSRGAGTSLAFGFAIGANLCGLEVSEKVAKGMLY